MFLFCAFEPASNARRIPPHQQATNAVQHEATHVEEEQSLHMKGSIARVVAGDVQQVIGNGSGFKECVFPQENGPEASQQKRGAR